MADSDQQPVARPVKDEIASTRKDIDIFAGYLTRLENPDPVLRSEAYGKGLRLYDEVERDPHAGAVLQTRYLSVIGKEWEVLPADESRKAKKAAELVEEALSSMNFTQACAELLQAVLYGFKSAEVMWQARGGLWMPKKIMGKHPRRFVFTPERELRLLTPQSMIDGEELPPRKFITFTWGDSDNPYGKGLGQKLWWPVWFKKHGVKFWLVFLEKFGMPTVVGKYPPGTDTKLQQDLMDALDAIQTETGMKIPENMTVELLEAARTGQASYQGLCDYMDRQISKAVLGQTLTTEVKDEGSYAASQTHDEVRQDIIKADADLLCECLNASLVRWIVDVNLGPQNDYPQLWIRVEEEQDLKPQAERDKILVREIGVPVARRYFYETYGLPEPEDGDELVTPPAAAAPVPPAEEAPAQFAERSEMTAEQQSIEALADDAIAQALPDFAANEEKIRMAIEGAADFEEAVSRLQAIAPNMASDNLVAALERSLLAAELYGRRTVREEGGDA